MLPHPNNFQINAEIKNNVEVHQEKMDPKEHSSELDQVQTSSNQTKIKLPGSGKILISQASPVMDPQKSKMYLEQLLSGITTNNSPFEKSSTVNVLRGGHDSEKISLNEEKIIDFIQNGEPPILEKKIPLEKNVVYQKWIQPIGQFLENRFPFLFNQNFWNILSTPEVKKDKINVGVDAFNPTLNSHRNQRNKNSILQSQLNPGPNDAYFCHKFRTHDLTNDVCFNRGLDHILSKHGHQWDVHDTIPNVNAEINKTDSSTIRTRTNAENRKVLANNIQKALADPSFLPYNDIKIRGKLGKGFYNHETNQFIGMVKQPDGRYLITKAYKLSRAQAEILQTQNRID